MTTWLFCSASGAPGVTAAVCALTQVWPSVLPERRILLVDADPVAGGVAAGWLRGQVASTGTGLPALAAARGADPVAAVMASALSLDEDGSRLLLMGVTDSRQAQALATAWSTLAAALPDLAAAGVDVLVDAGRLRHAHEPVPLRRSAARVVLVSGSSLPAVASARSAARAVLEEVGERARLLIVGRGRPYATGEVAAQVGLPLVGELPWDPVAAAVFAEGTAPGRRTARSSYVRAARALAAGLVVDADAVDDVVVSLRNGPEPVAATAPKAGS